MALPPQPVEAGLLHHPEPELAAQQIAMLRDGAMTAAYLDNRERAAAAMIGAGRAIVAYRPD
ncbi:hypothetical protein ACVCAH_18305 [Micromonospora sp. LZ34]